MIAVSSGTNWLQLEWVRQLSQDPKNFVIAVVRNPDNAGLLKPLLGPSTVSVKGDIADVDSFPVSYRPEI